MNNRLIVLILIAFSFIACNATQNPTEPNNSNTNPSNPDPGHHSQNSLDWEGIYQGILPCADCEGIQTEITLNKNLTYIYKTKYLGKEDTIFEKKGGFVWDGDGGKIALADFDEDKLSVKYMVGENALFKLDMKGERITGALADKYVLKKKQNQLTETYWRLVELGGQAIKGNKNNPKEAHMVLVSEDNSVSGSGGCNSFSGVYEVKNGNRITFSKMISTKMACKNMKEESNFFKVLEIIDNYTITGNTLVLNKSKIATLAKFEAVFFK
ncbi:MAG: META domain-containing protein [Chitinophagales bacterium]